MSDGVADVAGVPFVGGVVGCANGFEYTGGARRLTLETGISTTPKRFDGTSWMAIRR